MSKVVVIPNVWVVACLDCGFESDHPFEDSAEEAAQQHRYEGCGYR